MQARIPAPGDRIRQRGERQRGEDSSDEHDSSADEADGQPVGADGAAADEEPTMAQQRSCALALGPRVTRFRKLPGEQSSPIVAGFSRFGLEAIRVAAVLRGRIGPLFKAMLNCPDMFERFDDAAMAKASKKEDQQKQPRSDAKKTRAPRDRPLLELDTLRAVTGYLFGAPASGTFADEEQLKRFPREFVELINVCKKDKLKPLPQMEGSVAERQAVAAYVLHDDSDSDVEMPDPCDVVVGDAEADEADEEAAQEEEDEDDDESPGQEEPGRTLKRKPDAFQHLNQHKCDMNGTVITIYMNHIEHNVPRWFAVLAVTGVANAHPELKLMDDFARSWRLAHRAFERLVAGTATTPAAAGVTPSAATLAAEAIAAGAKKQAAVAKKAAAAAKKTAADAAPAQKAAATRASVAAARKAQEATDEAAAKAARVEAWKKKDAERAAQQQADRELVELFVKVMRECLKKRDPNESRLPNERDLKNESNAFFWFRFARDASDAVAAYNEVAKQKKLRQLRHVRIVPEVKPHQCFIQFGVQTMADLLVKWIGRDVVPAAWQSENKRKLLPRDKVVAAFAKVLPPGTLDWKRFWVYSFATDGCSIRATGHAVPAPPQAEDTAKAAVVKHVSKARTGAIEKLRGTFKKHGHRAVGGKKQAARRNVSPQDVDKHCSVLEKMIAVRQAAGIKELCRRFSRPSKRADRIKVVCAIDPGVTNIATIVFAYRNHRGIWTVDRYQRLRMHYASLLRRRAAAKKAGRRVPRGVASNIERLEATYAVSALCPMRHRKPIIATTAGFVARSGRRQRQLAQQAFQNGNEKYRQLMAELRTCTTAAERLKIHEQLRELDIEFRGRRNRKFTSLLRRKAVIDEFVNRIVGKYKKEEVVIGVGDWALRPTTGHFKLPPPIKQLVAALEKRATVVMLQEYHTSAACCQCGHRTTTKGALRDAVKKKGETTSETPPKYVSKLDKKKAKKARKTAKKEKARAQAEARKAMKATAGRAAATNEDAAAAVQTDEKVQNKNALWRVKQQETHSLLRKDVGTRPRHGTAVCTHVDCGVLWQRDINGATNLLRLLLAQIDKGEQTNNSRLRHLKYGHVLEEDPDFSFAALIAAKHTSHLDSEE